MAQFAIDEVLTTGIQISGFIFDYSSSLGTAGQVLTSTTSGVMWQADSSIVDLSSLSGQIAATGTTLNNKINSLSGYVNNTFLSGVGVSNYVPRWSGTKQLVTGNLYDNGINVGIGTNNPNTKLRVNGSFSHRPSGSSNIQEYKNIVTYNLDNNGNGGYVVKTPFQIGSAYEMAIVHVKGYGYGNASLYDFKVVFYDYGPASAPVNYSLIDLGNDGTSKYLAKDANGYMQICFGNPTDTSKYYYRFTVDCITTKNVDDWSQNWGMYQTTGTNFGFASTGVYQLDSPVNFNVATNFVGIGTVSASRKLHAYIPTGPVMRLQSSGSNASIEFAPSLAGNGLYNWLVGAQQNISNAFEITPSTAINGTTYSNPALLITSAGNVGIGITGPEAKLDVSANAVDMAIFRSSGGSANDKRLTIKSGGDRVILNVSDNSNTGTARAYEFQIAGIPAMTLTALGRLGVGLTNPATLVGVGGAGSTSAASGITFGGDASANLYRSAAGALQIDGSLGIGTSPSHKLHLYGANIRQTIESSADSSAIIIGQWDGITNRIESSSRKLFLTSYTSGIAFGINGSENMTLNTAGNLGIGITAPEQKLHIASSAGFTAIKFSNSTNSAGIISYSADNLYLYTANAQRLTIDTNGNVGIGTTVPTGVLTVHSNGTQLRLQTASGPGSYFATISSIYDATHPFTIAVANNSASTSEFFGIYADAGGANNRSVFPNGNVGIGSTIPAYKLDVNGSAGFTNGITVNADASSTSYFVGANGTRPIIFQNNTASAYDFGFKFTDLNTFTLVGGNTLANPTTDLVSFTYDGKVGIGLTAPTSKLHVVETTATGTRIQLGVLSSSTLMNAGSTNDLLILNVPYGDNPAGASNIGAKWGIKFIGSTDALSNSLGKTSAIYAVSEDTLGYNRGTSLAFYTNQLNDQPYAERMRIYHNGNIGIGVTNPSDKLQISGNISLTTSTGLAVPMLGILPTNAAYVGPYNTATDGNAPTLLLFNHGASVQQIYFYSSGRAAMVLNRQGRLNIAGNLGNTPPALLNVGPSSSVDAVSGMSFGNDASANLYRSTASTIKTDGSLVVNGNFNTNTTTVTTLNINAGLLPGIPAESTITGFTYAVNNGNVSQINLVETRFQTGSDWTTASTRIQKRTDVTNQAYIEFNPSGASYGMALGVGVNSNVEALRILSNGNVGIGTISPVTKLHIEQIQNAESLITLRNNRQDLGDVPIFGISAQNGITDVAKISFYRGGGGNAGYLAFSTKFDNASSLTEKFRIDGAGNVGIGTTNPVDKLHVIGNTTLVASDATSLGSGTKIRFYRVSDGWEPAQIEQIWKGTTLQGVLAFKTNTDTLGTLTTKMVIDNNGNVGIGTTNPATLLHVNTAGADARIRVSAGANTVQGGMIANTGTSLVYAGSVTNHGFSLRTNDTDRVRIDTNGNVGIGTASPVGKLTVQGDIEVNYNSTTADSFVRRTFLTSHALVNRGSNIRFGLIDGGGLAGMTVYNTASSSSGYNSQFIGFNTHEGNVSTDERMRITQSGYVGIGTFNPNAMLQINGDELIYANVAGAVNSNKLIFGSFANVNAAAIYSQTTSASAGDLILAPVVSSVITERVRVKSDGKVGIGTDGPTTLLSVGGAGSTSAASGLTFGGDASANLYRISSSRIKTDGSLEAVVGIISPTITSLSGNIAATGSTLDTKINTLSGYANSTFLSGQGIANWTSRWNGTKELITGSIYDLGTGIGIGTTSPTSRLTVVQSVGTDSVLLDLQSNNDPGIRFGRSTYGSLIRHISATVDYIAFNCNGASLPSVAATAQVVIDENGNVGVGTTNPGSRLDVRFPTNPATDNGAGNNVLRVWTTAGYAANVGGAIGLGGEYSGGLFQSFGQIAGRKTNNTSGNNAGYLQFATTNNAGTMSEWMRIDSGGNVGIGTTNPVELLDIAASADNSAVAGPKVNFKKGATTKAVIGIGGNYLGQATQTDDLIFRNDAGNILFGFAGAEKMRIASNGNVGIATTLPGYSLQIGQNTSGNNTDYSLGILRHGTLSFPSSWTSNPAFKIIDIVDGGPSNVDINGIINLELPRFQASDTNSEKASLFTITYDSALGPLRVDGKGNTWIGYDRAATGINTSTFSSLIYGGLAVGSNYQTTTLSNGQAIFEGNVGVGITAPNAKIHVLAADAATADLARFQQTNQGNLLIQSQQGNQSLGGSNGILFSNALGRIGFRTNASVGDAQVIINANGNVGINTTNPSSRLHIIQTSSNNALLLDSDSSSIYSTLEFNVSGVLKGQVFADSSDNSLFVRTNTLTGALKFGAANAERMRIDTSGNVGINTTNPIAKFVVNGGTVNTATYTSSQARIADGSLHLMKTAAGGIFESIRAMNVDTTAGTTVRVLAAATSDPFNNANGGKVFIDAIRTATNMDLAFSLNDVAGAAAVERVRFMGNGNVGIGITTPLQKLQVDGVVGSPASVGVTQSGIFRISNTTDNAVLDFGIRIAGSGAWIQSTDETSLAANYPLLLNPNGGNVGIGTLVPADKLHVIGNIRINGGDILNWGGQAFIQTIGANDMFFRPNSTFRMILTAVGNLGLGVLAPTTLLSVGGAGSTLPASGITFGEDASANLYRSAAGTLKTDGRLNIVGDASDSTPDLFFNGAGGFGSAGGQVRAWSPNNTTLSWYWDNTQFTYNNFPLRIVDGSSNVLVYFSATANSYVNGGNLGVGTSTPSGKLHVVSTVAGATVLRADGTNGTLFSVVDDLSDSLMSVNNSAGLPVLEVFADDRVVAGQYGSGDFVLVNNKVGIGTSNPSYKLDVRGSGVNARVGLMEFGTWPLDATYIYLQNNSLSLIGANYGFLQGPAGETFVNAAAGQTLHFRIGNSEKWAVTSAGILQSDGAQTIRTSTGPLTLATNAADGHIILSPNGAGNVGIGTTIPDAKLSINKGATNQLLALNMSNNTIKYSLYVDQDNNGSNSFSIFDTTNSQTAIKYLPTGNGSWQLYTNNVVRLLINNVGNVGIGTVSPTTLLSVGPVGSTLPASGLTFGGDAQANLYRSAEDTIKTDGSLIVAGALTVGTAVNLNSHVYGDKTVTLTTASYTTVLTVNLTAHTSCYVKIGAFGDWGNHSAVAFVSELFIQNGDNAGYGEPGTIITAHDNTRGPAGDKIDIQIVDPAAAGTQNFLIQLKLISATSGTFSSLITYHVMGQKVSVT